MGVVVNCATGKETSVAVTINRAPVAAVTTTQAKLALLGAGLLDEVETALNAIPDATERAAALIYWNANTFERNHPLIATMGAALNLNEAQIDALFATASAL